MGAVRILYLCIEAVGYPTVCRHCWAQGVPYRAMPMEDLAWVRACAPVLRRARAGFRCLLDSRGGGSPGRDTALPPLQRPLRLGAARHHVRALPTTGVPLAIREDWREVLEAAADTGTINENLLLRASVLTPHRLLPPYTSSPSFRSAPEEFGHRVDKRARASDQRDLDPRGGSLPRPARRLRCDLVVAQTDPATQAADSRRRKRPEDASPSNRYRRWMDCDRVPAFGPCVTIDRACGTCARGRARNATHHYLRLAAGRSAGRRAARPRRRPMSGRSAGVLTRCASRVPPSLQPAD